jgi:hypothetical protein
MGLTEAAGAVTQGHIVTVPENTAAIYIPLQ